MCVVCLCVCRWLCVIVVCEVVEKVMASKQDLLCMICAFEPFWLILMFACSVTCDRLYEKKTAGPKKPLKEAFSSNASCYRADARNTSARVFYSNASCYRADARNTNERGSYHA